MGIGADRPILTQRRRYQILWIDFLVDVIRVPLAERSHQDAQSAVHIGTRRVLGDGVGAHPSSFKLRTVHGLQVATRDQIGQVL